MLFLPEGREDWPDVLGSAIETAQRESGPDRPGPDLLVYLSDPAGIEILTAAGFRQGRTEVSYRAALAGLRTPVHDPRAGWRLLSAADADLNRLRELDEVIRDDIPGTRGWRWEPGEFRGETFGTGFDRQTYLIAIDRAGVYVGLVRVWLNPTGPRLGCIGVRAEHRRTRVTAALLGAVVANLARRGFETLDFEISLDNAASLALLRHLRVEELGRVTELVRP